MRLSARTSRERELVVVKDERTYLVEEVEVVTRAVSRVAAVGNVIADVLCARFRLQSGVFRGCLLVVAVGVAALRCSYPPRMVFGSDLNGRWRDRCWNLRTALFVRL